MVSKYIFCEKFWNLNFANKISPVFDRSGRLGRVWRGRVGGGGDK